MTEHIEIDQEDVVFNVFPQAPDKHFVSYKGENAGYLQLDEIMQDKKGNFAPMWRATRINGPANKSRLFSTIDDGVRYLVNPTS
jgi:hypothetical protein